jgi:hypothetical protein
MSDRTPTDDERRQQNAALVRKAIADHEWSVQEDGLTLKSGGSVHRILPERSPAPEPPDSDKGQR